MSEIERIWDSSQRVTFSSGDKCKTLEHPTLEEIYATAQALSANTLQVDDLHADRQWIECRIEKCGDRYQLYGYRDYWDGRTSRSPSLIAEGPGSTRVSGWVDIENMWHESWNYAPDVAPGPCFAEVESFTPVRRPKSRQEHLAEPEISATAGASVSKGAETFFASGGAGSTSRKRGCSSRCQTSKRPASTCRCSCGGTLHGTRAKA